MSDKLLNSFLSYAKKEPKPDFAGKDIAAQKNFIRTRLRFDLAMSAFGSVAANQILNQDDEQVAKAAEALPQAQQLAISAEKIRLNRRRSLSDGGPR